MTTSVIAISPWSLALASLLVVVAIAVMIGMKLGIARQFAIAAVRGFIQLMILGYVLSWLFNLDSGLVVIAVLLVMSGVASLTAAKRVHNVPGSISPNIFVILFVICLIITLIVTGFVIHVKPWYLPQYVIPIGGMLLGNGMTGMAISLERMFRDLDQREDEIRGLIALGATPYEVALPSLREGVKAGLIPTMNTMAAVGIVTIPGTMAGQILAGTTPSNAAPYQIVILFMISAADAIGSMIITHLLYKRRFNEEGAFVRYRDEVRPSLMQRVGLAHKSATKDS